MKREEKELLAMHKEIEDELEENKFIGRSIGGIPDKSLTIQIKKKKKMNDGKKEKKKRKTGDNKEKETIKKRRNEEGVTKPMEIIIDDDNTHIGVESAFDDLDVEIIPLFTEDPWNNLEVPWEEDQPEILIERMRKNSKKIDNLSLDQIMKRYVELIVLGKGGQKVPTSVKDRTIIDFLYIQRAYTGKMMSSYADKKKGKMIAICKFVGTLGSKIVEFDVKQNGAQAQCFFENEKLKKADAYVATITMEDRDKKTGEKFLTTTTKYVHKKLVRILHSVLFILGFNVSVTGTIEDFVNNLNPLYSLKEKVKLVNDAGISQELIGGLVHSIRTITDETENIEGIMDDRWYSY